MKGKQNMKGKHIHFRSREKKENNVIVVIQAKSEKEADQLFESIKKAVQKENRLMEHTLGFEIHCSFNEQNTF